MALKDAPEKLQPYLFYGVDLAWSGTGDAKGTCPFCGKERHFFVNQENGLWNCKVCNEGSIKGGGNIYTFLANYWELCREYTRIKPDNNGDSHFNLQKLAATRGLKTSTLIKWGVVRGVFTDEWIIPSHNLDKKIINLYRWAAFKTDEGIVRRFIGCPGLDPGLFGMNLYSKKKTKTELAEGPWDGMALYEALSEVCDKGSGKLDTTSNFNRSIAAFRNILAVPGCETFLDKWVPIFRGHDLRLWYDNDHPRRNKKTDTLIEPASQSGMRKVVQLTNRKARSHKIIEWGPDGFDPNKLSGYDIRDHYRKHGALAVASLPFISPPEEWMTNPNIPRDSEGNTVEPIECQSYTELVNYWRKALKWTELLDTTLSVMIACAIGTDLKSQSDTVWIRVIGPPGSAKTTLCEALSISNLTFPTSVQRGFHSGYKGKGDNDEEGENTDASLIPLIQNKTVIIKDGDTLLTSPARDQTLAELRDIYDGTSRAHFKNKKHSIYKGINTTFILAGTSSLRKLNRAYLGERFLDCIIYDRGEKNKALEDEILNRAAFGALRCMRESSDGSEEGLVDANLLEAWKRTAGYLNWLRSDINVPGSSSTIKRNLHLIRKIDCSDSIISICKSFGSYVSYMRAKPDRGLEDEDDNEVELPTRLTRQFVRLANLLAVTLNRDAVDTEVMERVAKVVRDTSRGFTYKIVCLLYEHKDGMSVTTLSGYLKRDNTPILRHLKFLRSIGVVRPFKTTNKTGNRGNKKHIWELTPTVRRLHAVLAQYRVITTKVED